MENRELKFRIWNKIDKVMLKERQADLLLFIGGGLFSRFDKEIQDPEDYVIQQFTGILDKNNKEIYEGDICTIEVEGFDGCQGKIIRSKIKNEVRIVEFMNCGSWNISQCGWGFCVYVYEIIGNIFENPELIK